MSNRSPTTLGEISAIRTGKLDANAQNIGGKYPFFTCGDETLRIDTPAFDAEAVLLAGNGNFGVKYYKGKFNAYQRTYVIEPSGVDGKWLFYLVLRHISRITSSSRGSTIPYLRLGDIADCEVELPPLAEQKRIVLKIEELFSELDAGEESLRRARRQLGVYRQSLLKQAFEGKLTAPWRLSARKRAQAGTQIDDVVPEARTGQWFAYIIECDGDSYYIGSTHDLRERWNRHCEGTGADWTKTHRPCYLVHFETFASEEEARKRESDLKTGFGRTWRKREIKAGRIKPLVHNASNPKTEPVRGEALPTGDQLLTRIQAERQARYEERLKEWEAAVKAWKKEGESYPKPAKPRAIGKLEPISQKELAGFVDLPSGWSYVRLGNTIASIDAGKSFSCDERPPDPDEVGVAKVSAVTWGEYDEKESKTCRDPSKVNPSYFIDVGDFLLSRANTIELVGAVVLVKRVERRIMLSDKTLRIHFGGINESFVLQYLRSHVGRREIMNRSSGNQMSMRNIGQDRIASIVAPTCSLPEQQEIVRLLDEQFEVIEQNEREIDAALKRSEALRQSILKKAFTGHLVPQDPTDEPASVLLERIRAERETTAKLTTPKKKVTKKKATRKRTDSI